MGLKKVAEVQETGTVAAEEAERALVAGLKEKHGVASVHVLSGTQGETVYVRMPTSAVWRRFRTQMLDERKRMEALEVLFKSCLLHPSHADFDAMCEERPGILDNFSGALVELAGMEKDIQKKVL